MKRSEINMLIKEAITFINKHQFKLPPFAFWTPEEWKSKGSEYNEIRESMLGWDITDYGLGNFYQTGLLLFTIRNGLIHKPAHKTYAEKLLIVRENQITPYHFHWKKMEDIINRGGGILCVKLYNSSPDGSTFLNTDISVSIDGRNSTAPAGTIVELKPGESITLPTGLYHKFWGKGGTVLVGEVSQVNDDRTDNRYHDKIGRFPLIEEDAPPLHLLFSEYPNL